MNEAVISIGAAESGPWLLHLWGLELIRAIQAVESPFLTALIKGITALGTELFYIPVIMFIFWCVDERQGFRLGILILVSAWLNGFFKGLLKQPRPYDLDPSVYRVFEPTYGLPSGHAQFSLVFWAALVFGRDGPLPKDRDRTRLVRIAAVLIVLVMAFTRLYLGVHFPTDILGGWFLGALILALYFFLGEKLAAFLSAREPRIRLIVTAALVLLMNALYPGDKSLGGLLLGFSGGYVLMRERRPFIAGAEIQGKKPGALVLGLRCLLGFTGAALIYAGLKLVFPGEGSMFAELPVWGPFSPYYELGRFIRYGLLGLWAAAGAPRVFQQLGLAANKNPPENFNREGE